MKKIINPYKDKTYGGRSYNVFMEIEYTNGKLSISGVEGPLPSGNCLGGCGQLLMNFKEYDPRGYMSINDVQLTAGWNRKMLKKFFDIWDKWHLNDMQSACEHQRELGWTYATHKGQHCPTCGYLIGSAWLTMEVPQDVIDFLFNLPDTKITPAWV